MNTADIAPAIDEPAITAAVTSVDIIRISLSVTRRKAFCFVSDDVSLNPVVPADSWIWVATLSTPLASLVI
jgi:hypothetical protein